VIRATQAYSSDTTGEHNSTTLGLQGRVGCNLGKRSDVTDWEKEQASSKHLDELFG